MMTGSWTLDEEPTSASRQRDSELTIQKLVFLEAKRFSHLENPELMNPAVY